MFLRSQSGGRQFSLFLNTGIQHTVSIFAVEDASVTVNLRAAGSLSRYRQLEMEIFDFATIPVVGISRMLVTLWLEIESTGDVSSFKKFLTQQTL